MNKVIGKSKNGILISGSFVGEHVVKYASRKYETADSKEPLTSVIRSVRNKPESIWNARELKDAYLSKDGTDSNVNCVAYGFTLELCKRWNCLRKVSGKIAQHTTQLVSRGKECSSFTRWVMEQDLKWHEYKEYIHENGKGPKRTN